MLWILVSTRMRVWGWNAAHRCFWGGYPDKYLDLQMHVRYMESNILNSPNIHRCTKSVVTACCFVWHQRLLPWCSDQSSNPICSLTTGKGQGYEGLNAMGRSSAAQQMAQVGWQLHILRIMGLYERLHCISSLYVDICRYTQIHTNTICHQLLIWSQMHNITRAYCTAPQTPIQRPVRGSGSLCAFRMDQGFSGWRDLQRPRWNERGLEPELLLRSNVCQPWWLDVTWCK